MLKGITRNVIVLGWVSLLTDMASEMLYPLIPLFVMGTLGQSPAMLGIIEGLAEGIATGLRWVGGVLSDLAQRRKPFVSIGYGISALSKPLMGAAQWVAAGAALPTFLAGRASDRFGKSIRTAARDALIADATDPAYRGKAFGFHRAMDTIGAILGPLIAAAILILRPQTPLGLLFILAVIPGAASALLAQLAVTDIPRPADKTAARAKLHFWQHYPSAFWLLLAANAIFSLGNSSDTFLIARSAAIFAGHTAADSSAIHDISPASIHIVITTCLLYASFNVIFALTATPLGALSDKLGRKPVILAGWIIYAAVYLGFAAFDAPWAPWLFFGIYGLYQALTDGVTKAFVTDLVPRAQRAGAIGLFYSVSGAGQLAGSILAGALWNTRLFHGRVMLAFLLGTMAALLAVPALLAVRAPRLVPDSQETHP